ncbi:tetratricopeptide repeat-containing sulfotransferase family protein [Sphingomicrobium nitratireducens]|uniref:tetratricopeptide repeat-containing sulfotransferase family protein n=1 Tax=Sphingomicrobium nitratireducens TaxID=2964666 RepID=UPI00223F6A51|nr:tetratricopeptide repeat-containing sulfotransferase family protein [Sphingomicrobium nitratireducens]
MNSDILNVTAESFRRAAKAGDRSALVAAATALIKGRATLGRQWLDVALHLKQWGEVEKALSAFDLWGQQDGTADEAAYEKAVLLALVGRSAEAQALLDAIPDATPTPFANAYLRGSIATALGKGDEAERHYRRTIALHPEAGRAWIEIVKDGRATETDEKQLRQLAQGGAVRDMIDRAAIENAFGILADKSGDHETAFAHFARATEIQGEKLHYDGEDNRASARVAMRWDRAWLDRLSLKADSPRTPIFVTGLPRSGTTLVERILSAHSAVDGGGELGLALHLEATAGGFAPEDLDRFASGSGALALRDLYLRLAAERLPGTGMFVDKSLNQSRSLGPLAALFPDAPIVWMRRDPLDNGWSIFRSWFSGNVVAGWSLVDIADHMKIEDQLLAHWQEQLGDRLLVLSYRDLIEDPERWIGTLARHCGLVLEPMQLTPHLAPSSVATASAQQVREPINRKGIGVAEPYRAWLGPLSDGIAVSPKANAPTPAPSPAPSPVDDAMERMQPRDLLELLKQAMANRDRAKINRLIEVMVRRRIPLGNQWRAMAQLTQFNGEYALMRRVLDQWQHEVGASPAVLCERARMLAEAGDPKEAWEIVRKIELTGVSPLAINYLKGTLSTDLGNLDFAADYLREAVAAAPSSGQSWLALAMTGRMDEADGARLEAASNAFAQAPVVERAAYQFALGRWKERQQDHRAAFEAYRAGGEMMAAERKSDPQQDVRNFENAIQFDRKRIDALAATLTPREHSRPLFVSGLPRSGTTLVEQILAAHSDVAGGGELGLMTKLEHDLRGNSPEALDAYLARGGTLDALRDLHDHLLDERFAQGGHVVDKTLYLSRTMGLVAALYPKANFVWMRRDPADCAWSTFRTFFVKSVDWGWRLDDIARHFNLEDKLFEHWSREMGERMLVVPYADLVEEPATWTERITRHLGLEPQVAQLESHKVERTVATASAAQVREPINRKGLDVAGPYREWMAPFFDVYEGEGR